MTYVRIASEVIPIRYHPSTGPYIDARDLLAGSIPFRYLKPAYRQVGNTIGLIPLQFFIKDISCINT